MRTTHLVATLLGLAFALSACSDEQVEPPQRVTDDELQQRIDELLVDDPSAVNCGLEITGGVLNAYVVPPLTDADAIQADLANRMDVPASQVHVTVSGGTCGDD